MNLANMVIMKLFKAYLKENDTEEKEFVMDKEALKQGICISEKCSKEIIDLACEFWGKDGFLLNQTFHKSFNTVLESSQLDLVIQQIMHYMTTYGFEEIDMYNENFVYIPNERLDVPEIKEDIKLIKISSITKEELKDKLLKLCESGVALSNQTVGYIVDLSDYMGISKDNIDIIKNREVKSALYKKLDIVPEEPDEFVRYLIYSLICSTLLIKDKETINMLNRCNKKLALELIEKYDVLYGIKRLAEVFNRFKPLFLALKTNEKDKKEKVTVFELELNKKINKISHLSKKYHKPMIKNDLDMFIDWCIEHEKDEDFKKQIEQKLEQAGIWRTIKLKNYLASREYSFGQYVYKIRNGRVWIEEAYKPYKFYTGSVLKVLDKIIIKKLKKNVDGKKIYLDDSIELVLPQSEKQFAGNIPFASSLVLDKENLIFGIHWNNVNNERIDLDLKLISNDYTVGWDANYKKGDKIIFSGDVTDAPLPKGATECIYIDKTIGKTLLSVKINNYTSDTDDVKYDIIIAKGDKGKLHKNYIIDPNDIIVKIPDNTLEKGKFEHSVGVIIIDKNLKLIFTDLSTGNRISASNNELESILREFLLSESKYKCKLREYLEKAGAVIINDDSEEVDINLGINDLNKDSLIDLFA